MNLIDHPLLVLVLTFLVLWLSELIGTYFRERRRDRDRWAPEDFGVVLAATLTLLGLIIGFSFSMAISRYDQRKNDEEGEANAIGTEWVRADLLPVADAARVRALLREYVDQRVSFYRARDTAQLERIDSTVGRLQNELWAAVRDPALAQPTPVLALAVSGMNDVFNSQGYTQAAWWNRIPIEAWALLAAIAICCNLLIGYGGRHVGAKSVLLLVLPIVASISFFLIADIDSPRGGFIRVHPQNLETLSQAMRAR
jgi:hypothetical protein